MDPMVGSVRLNAQIGMLVDLLRELMDRARTMVDE